MNPGTARDVTPGANKVIIVGTGLAGLVAGYEAQKAGRHVIFVDQESRESLGGQAFWSLGGLFMVGSPEQKMMRVNDYEELAWMDWENSAYYDPGDNDTWPRRWGREFVRFATHEMHGYLKGLGLRVLPTIGWAERGSGDASGHGNSVPRFHVTWGTGPEVVRVFREPLLQAEKEGTVEFRFRHRVDDIVVENGRAVGVAGVVLADDPAVRGAASNHDETGAFELRGAGVVIATGGIGGNLDKVRRMWPDDRWGPCPENLVTGVPDCAMNARVTVVEVEEIVPRGALDPASIHTPSIYVDRIVPLTYEQSQYKPIEQVTLYSEDGDTHTPDSQSGPGWSREQMAQRAALELRDGEYVNLGIGLPTLVPSFVDDSTSVCLQSENGILKTGRFPRDYELDPGTINAGKQTVTVRPGGSFFSSSSSFAMIRGGHIDTAILGAFQVSQSGDIANWGIPGKNMRGMGGAMDLVEGARRVIVLMEHTAPDGGSRVLPECTYPLTAKEAVSKIITNLCVFEVDPERGLTLVELAPGVSVEDVERATEADFVSALD